MKGFQKGHKKIGGKEKGTKNKATVLFEGTLIDNRIELLEIAIKMAKGGNERILLKLLDKILPNLSSVEGTLANEKREPFVLQVIRDRIIE